MSMHSVSCWCFLNKVAASGASSDGPGRAPIACPCKRWVALLACRSTGLAGTAAWLLTRGHPRGGVLTFGRTGAHFRENWLHLCLLFQSDIRLKIWPNCVLTVSDVNVEGCSLTGEVALTFGRSMRVFGTTCGFIWP